MRALITGVNSLLNQTLLTRLIELGYQVVAHYHTDNELTSKIKSSYPKVKLIQADFAQSTSYDNFLQSVLIEGKYNVVVNGAVYYAEAKDAAPQLSWQAWQDTFAVNTTAAGILMSHADKLLEPRGVIVNISSTYGQSYMGDIQFAMYSASKSALDSLTKTYAKRWHSLGIRVVGIAPGWVRSAWNKDMSKVELAQMVSEPHLVTKLIEPSEIADLMEQLIKNPGINATTVTIDAGLSSPII